MQLLHCYFLALFSMIDRFLVVLIRLLNIGILISLLVESNNSSWVFIAVVNLTLVDLPGLTKVAVGMFIDSHVIGFS